MESKPIIAKISVIKVQHDSHVRLWRLWKEYNLRPLEQLRMFRIWVSMGSICPLTSEEFARLKEAGL